MMRTVFHRKGPVFNNPNRLVSILALGIAVVTMHGCMSVQKVHQPPEALRENIRSGELVGPGDRIVVVTATEGEKTLVVTEIDQDTIFGDGVEVPIDEVVTLEKRRISPARTGLAVYGGLALLPYAFWGLVIVGSMLGL
ncbi:MAG: hypothetical protein OXK76_11505 [Gammaproteobacteria bacterium]|nr:hypothetical protein [Gammaproteobacteria bacterium]